MKKWVDQIYKLKFLTACLIPVFLAADRGIDPVANSRRMQAADFLSYDDFYSYESLRTGIVFDAYPPLFDSSGVHWLTGVSSLGDSVEIEDGSIWKIHPRDGYKALSWLTSDPLTITQNTSWFSNYEYRIVNRATGTSIEANLFLGPLEYGDFTRYVVYIDWAMGDIVLSDNTRWQISCYDTTSFSRWAVNDAVIIGSNSGWDSSCESILINVNMNHFIRAMQF